MFTDAQDIRTRLARYLDVPASYFRVLASGWETTVFEFALTARSSKLTDMSANQPLALRLYDSPRADDKGAREAATISLLAKLNYPVPRLYLFQPDHEPLGAPFLIMERVGGGPLFTPRSFALAFKTFALGFCGFVRAQARLHRIGVSTLDVVPQAYPANGAKSAPLLERMLDVIGERIEQTPLPRLSDALRCLRERASHFSCGPERLVHMDYHPQNVIVSGLRVTGVIDWVNADCGDRHLCAATTAVILSCSAMERPRWMRENAAGNTLRALFASLYLPLYHALAPMELERFRYAQAVAALLRLSMFGLMKARGAASAGFHPEAGIYVTPSMVRLLSRYATRKIGVPVSIEPL